VALDSAGNMYVADRSNAIIRKITPAGVVTTVGSNILPGSQYGSQSIAADSSGSVFFAIGGRGTAIRKVTASGSVVAVAGDSQGGFLIKDGVGASAVIAGVHGMAVNSRDELFISDEFNRVIRKIARDGTVTTFAGMATESGASPFIWERRIADGSATEARFRGPRSLAVDGADNLFVDDFGTLRRIADGAVTTFVSVVSSPLSADARGNLYVQDERQRILKGVEVLRGDPRSRLVNASVFGLLQAQQPLLVGFNLRGPARPILMRAIGPGLGAFAPGVVVASDLRLDTFGSSGLPTASNDNWGGGATLTAAFGAAGAFPLANDSTDAALMQTVAGQNTLRVTSPSAGAGLVELFDLGAAESGIFNLSVRQTLDGSGAGLTLGFTIAGPVEKTILIRGIGPALAAAPFNLAGAVHGAGVSVYDTADGEWIAGNGNWWVGQAFLPIVFERVGAFPLEERSGDSALVVNLAPGSYTAVLNSAGAGEAMIELYEVP
jgi:hypothetical protein